LGEQVSGEVGVEVVVAAAVVVEHFDIFALKLFSYY
jgi:hypothetical protein